MKRALILHAMHQTSQGHWYPWLKAELEKRGYEVWVPDLPHADHPDTAEMTNMLLANKKWDFKDNLVIGHSAGAVEIFFLLQALPKGVMIKTAVPVGSFEKPVLGMEDVHDKISFDQLNFADVKSRAQKFVFVHGEDDPWCPLEGAKNLAQKLDGELVAVPGGKHFSTTLDPAYTKFPKLVEILETRNLL